MGAQVAAHLANAGVPTLLLDVTREAAQAGLERARALRPDPFFTPTAHALIRTGGLDRRFRRDCRERLDHRSGGRAPRREAGAVRADRGAPARQRRRQLEYLRHPDLGSRERTLGRVSTALSRYALLQSSTLSAPPRGDSYSRHRSGGRRRHLHVCRSSARQRRRHCEGHAQLHRQPPGSPRRDAGLSMHSQPASTRSRRSMRSPDRRSAVRRARRFGRSTSPASTCSQHVARNLSERLDNPDDRALFAVPPSSTRWCAAGWTGAKAGQGFYKKTGDGEILTLDPATMEYRPSQPARLPSLDAARTIDDVRERSPEAPPGEGQGQPASSGTHSCPRWITPSAPHPRSHIRPPTWIVRCGGVSAGSWVRSSFGATRRAHRRSWEQRVPAASCGAMRARASSTSATESSASSSIRR